MVKKALPKNLEKHLYDLHLLNEASPRQKKALLEQSPASLVRAVCQCCDFVLKGDVQIDRNQFHKLKRHRKQVRQLAGKGNLKTKRQLLVRHQKGGFLGALLGPLIAPIIGGITSLFSK
jgi:hypothetical protein